MIEIHTLGRTRVAVNGQPLTGEAAWPRSLALIVYMAREPGPDRRQEILGVLWPDREERRARRALNQLIYTLRKASPELDLESVSDALDFGKEVWLDVEEFERRLDAGDLVGAVELYDGPFLVDLTLDEPEFDHWADRQRADARRKFRKAALQLAGERREVGDYEAGIAYCRRLIQSDQLDDESQHLLIECLHLRGDRAGALRQFDKYREALASELEVEPLDHTLALVARIRGDTSSGGEEPPSDAAIVEAPVGESEAGKAIAEPRVEEAPGPTSPRDVKVVAGSDRRSVLAGLLRSRVLIGVAGLILGAVLGSLVPGLVDSWGSESAVAGGTGAGARVAVLPFETHRMGPDEDDVGEGVAQLLSLDLDTAGVVATVAHRAVLSAWENGRLSQASLGEPRRLRELAAALGVAEVVVGDVHSAGDELRIVAELIDVNSGEVLARSDVSGPGEQMFALIRQIVSDLGARQARADTP